MNKQQHKYIRNILLVLGAITLIIHIPILLFFAGGCIVGYIWFQIHKQDDKKEENKLSSIR